MDKVPLKKIIEGNLKEFKENIFCEKNINIFIEEFIKYCEFPEENAGVQIKEYELKKLSQKNFKEQYNPDYFQQIQILQKSKNNFFTHLTNSFDIQEFGYYYNVFKNQSVLPNFWEKCHEAYSSSHILLLTNPEWEINYQNLIKMEYSQELKSILEFFLNHPYRQLEAEGFWLNDTQQITIIPDIIEDRFHDYLKHSLEISSL